MEKDNAYMGSGTGLRITMEIGFEMEAMAIQLVTELDSHQDSVILVPAPYPKFEGHMIRARACKGPEWLQWMRDKESTRVRRGYLQNALLNIGSGIYQDTRYYKLAIELINIHLGGTNEDYFSYLSTM